MISQRQPHRRLISASLSPQVSRCQAVARLPRGETDVRGQSTTTWLLVVLGYFCLPWWMLLLRAARPSCPRFHLYPRVTGWSQDYILFLFFRTFGWTFPCSATISEQLKINLISTFYLFFTSVFLNQM